MGKVVVAEATARQVASFVLGAAAALTVVMLVQYRAPAAGLSRARTPAHFSGLRLSSDDQHHRRNATTTARPVVHHQAPPVAGSAARDDDHRRRANATTITKPNSTTTSHLPSTRRHEEKAPYWTCSWRASASATARRGSPHYHYTIPGLNIDFAALKYFLSKDYLELVWSKLKLQRRILELGYGFLFTDVDIMWLRDPFKHVTAYADMTVSSDVFKHVTAYADMTVSSDVYFGDPDNLGNFPNTGFFHVKPNARTIAMTKLWHGGRGKYPGANEQPVFNMMKKQMVAELGLRVQYLNPAYVGGFCSYGKDLGKIVTMHANCCVGIGNKIRDLKGVLGDWRNYTRMPPWERHRAKWTVPGACIRAEKQV
uniref:Nucleotide-diphospho-sugar transferase domain-containing protein n=1 Tax=Aegilops tauschii TaxID=37682 RepID=M8B740_AEGTA